MARATSARTTQIIRQPRVPTSPSLRYGNDRDPVKRTPFGLGHENPFALAQVPQVDGSGAPDIAQKCLRCSFGRDAYPPTFVGHCCAMRALAAVCWPRLANFTFE